MHLLLIKFFKKIKFYLLKLFQYTWINFSIKYLFYQIWIFFNFILIIFLIFFIFSNYMQIQMIRYISIWLNVLLLFYWIIAAIWCLYDKDDYGRNVSASDDFYNVSFTALWLVEGFLLSLFLSYAKLFDLYDPFLEVEDIEATFVNEDIDLNNLKFLLVFYLIAIYISLTVDFLISIESLNIFWFIISIISFNFYILLSFLRISIKFIEEFDFEEDSDDIFDEINYIFEHEDFPEEAFDGGDYAEGYEILQLFFGYWHYMLISLHLFYLTYAVFNAKGKQTHIYWCIIAICQNVVLIIILDYLDWSEILLTFEIISFDSIYFWFFLTEIEINIIKDLYNIFYQIIYYIYLILQDLFFYENKNNIISYNNSLILNLSLILEEYIK